MTAIVSSIVNLLYAAVPAKRRLPAAADNGTHNSNGCARPHRFLAVLLLILALHVPTALAQDPAGDPAPPSAPKSRPWSSLAPFLAGAAVGLGTHEGGHLLFDVVFDAPPGLAKVDFHGIPFFAITHRSDLSPRREFIVSSAGFWVQHAETEWLLTRRPGLRREHAPFAKGVFAFDVLASVAYAGAAFARTGPVERDTRGMADAARVDERWIGALILAPALLDTLRYFHPEAKWASWASRGVKIGMVVMVVR
jgi:hypothetical protein